VSKLLTLRTAVELIGHEAIVREWYKDSVGVGTWGVGVTNASGHEVDRYKDAPTSIKRVLDVYIWLLREVYIPPVLKAFADFDLNEHQFAAAVSFHYNTGRIHNTAWVGMVKKGQRAAARQFLTTHYLNKGTLQSRRNAEAALFFDGKWEHEDGMVSVFPVRKPSYQPNFSAGVRVDIRKDMAEAMA